VLLHRFPIPALRVGLIQALDAVEDHRAWREAKLTYRFSLFVAITTVRRSSLAKATLFLMISAALVVGYLFLLGVFRDKLGSLSGAVPALFLASAALLLNRQFFRADGQSLASIGLSAASVRVGRILLAFVAGCLLVLTWAVTLRALTHVSWHVVPVFNATAAAGSLIFIIFNNAAEELIYRGYLFLLLATTYGATAAVLFTCCLFTILHIQGGVPWPNALAGVLTSALVFAAIFLRWQSLPLALSFHAATNFMQELIGLRTSGLSLWSLRGSESLSLPQSSSVLIVTATINVLLALIIFNSSRLNRANRQAVR
jgi:membrane protease YdiL (CAAX protease family)